MRRGSSSAGLKDGKKLKMLKRQLQSRYGLTPDQYRDKWGLPHDYPMVAPDYAETRSALAKSIGLGRKPAATAVIEAPAPAPRRPRKKSTRERRLTAAGNRSPPLSPPPSPPPTGSSCQRPSLCAGGGAGQRYGGAGEGPLRWSQLPVKPTWCPSRIPCPGSTRHGESPPARYVSFGLRMRSSSSAKPARSRASVRAPPSPGSSRRSR